MNTTVAHCIFDDPTANREDNLYGFAQGLTDSIADFHEFVSTCPADYLALCEQPANCSADRTAQLLETLRATPGAGAAVAGSSRADSIALTDALGGLSIFVSRPRLSETVLVDRRLFEQVGPLESSADPLCSWLVKLSQSGHAIAWLPVVDAADDPLPKLVPGASPGARRWLRDEVWNLAPPSAAVSQTSWTAFQAGVLQIHGFLDESHEKSQSIQHQGTFADGDYWHGIMHRREPDYSNAKYWFRNTGQHPVFASLTAGVGDLLPGEPSFETWARRLCTPDWDPFAFVDLCQHCATAADAELTRIAESIQWREMCLLLTHCYEQAVA